MKKTLLAFAAAAVAMTAAAQVSFKLETVWAHNVANGEANPVENLNGNWANPNSATPTTQTCSRFGVGYNGKIITTDLLNNKLIAFNGEKAATAYADLPANTSVDNFFGTAITKDDAGNIIFNRCFTSKPQSAKYWYVLDKAGNMTPVELETSADYLGIAGNRLDIISHIIGDVTSEEGGIGYACVQNSFVVVMFHFKGDGEKCTELTAAVDVEVEKLTSTNEKGANSQLQVPTPKYFTVEETLNEEYPAAAFYVPVGYKLKAETEAGTLATFEDGEQVNLTGFGNRLYGTVAKFQLGGETYIVRNYVNAEKAATITWGMATMNFGIFNLKGELLAEWQESDYGTAYGMGTLTVEPVDDSTVNIYPFASVGSAYMSETGLGDHTAATRAGVYGAMVKATLDTSAVTEIELTEEGEAEYFNLQGVRVANPENGLYIRRQGNKASKVLVK